MGQVIQLQTDSLRSLLGGLGDPSRDKRAGVYYGQTVLTDDQLLNAYRSSWLPRNIVDIPALDAIRKGRDWQADGPQIEAIEAEEQRLGFWIKIHEALRRARLWGGAAIYIAAEGDPSQPLDAEKLKKGGIRYLTVLSRREISAGELDQDALSETYGWPRDYEVTGSGVMAKVHPSRLVVLVGNPHPDPWLAQGPNRGWGDSALEAVIEAVKNADASAANIASLLFEANVDVFGVPNFMSNLSDPSYRSQVTERATLAAMNKSINKTLLMDSEEKYERKQVSFSTLPEVLQQFLQIVSGASRIPATLLLGQSPDGMNATGASDLQLYASRIASIQSLEVQPAIRRLDECLIRSALGNRPPEIHYRWRSLWELSEQDKAEVFSKKANAIKTLKDSGLIVEEALAEAATNMLVEDGFLPGLEAAMDEFGTIADQPEPTPEELMATMPQPDPASGTNSELP
jgi:uncharacterized protein